MNPRQSAFYRQAQSDWELFAHLRQPGGPFPVCHQLHYLQMCTEKLAKAYFPTDLGLGHAAFRRLLNELPFNPAAVAPLGFADMPTSIAWQTSVLAVAGAIEDLAPALADRKGLPNPEYPWPKATPTVAPADYDFQAEVFDRIDAQLASGQPPFLDVLERMVNTLPAWAL